MRTAQEKLAAALHEASVYGIGATSSFNQKVILEAAKDSERLRAGLETAAQLETALSEYLADLNWKPTRAHIERARNDAARIARATTQSPVEAHGKCASR